MFASKTLILSLAAAALCAVGCGGATTDADAATTNESATAPDPAAAKKASPQATWVVYTLPG